MKKPVKTFKYKGNKVVLYEGDTLYHGTTTNRLESILEYGILPEYSSYNLEAIWLDSDYASALSWGSWFERPGSPVVLSVKVEDLDLSKIELDPYNDDFFDELITAGESLETGMATFIYTGAITPEKIKVEY